MSGGGLVVILLAVLLTATTVGWFLLNRKHPEAASSDRPTSGDGSESFFGDPDDRPGSPGAEADGVAEHGRPAPGPSAETTDPTRPDA